MPPIIAIVGNSGAGKTTLLESLIRELTSRGYRIATLKHACGNLEFDKEGKDSWRYSQAGSEAVLVKSSDRLMLIKNDESANIEDVIKILGEEYDLVLVEGFKKSNVPKIAVVGAGGSLPEGIKRLVAIVSDEQIEGNARQFSFDQIKELADLLEEGFISAEEERLSLYVNGKPIVTKAYIKELLSETVTAMVSTLKGASDIENLELYIKKGKVGQKAGN